MARYVSVYLVMHQPRRLRLPAGPIRPGATPEEIRDALFDDTMNESYFKKVARTSYAPTLALLDQLAGEGMALNIGMSLSFLEQLDRYQPELGQPLAQLLSRDNVELVGVEPYHSFLPYIDIARFQKRMGWMRKKLEKRFKTPIRVTDTTEMMMSNDIYFALAQMGFEGMVMDGRPAVLGTLPPTRLYQAGRPAYLLTRHLNLSDDVGYRFSDRNWPGFPLMAPDYAEWMRETGGDFVFIGWDFETFGEHHRTESGVFDFLRRFPKEVMARDMAFRTASQIVSQFRDQAAPLTLPIVPSTWAGSGGIDFFLGNVAQEKVFRLMHHAYHKAVLTKNKDLLDLALWLLQSDNLHLIQWYGRTGAEAEVSRYFTPQEWWRLGPDGIIDQIVHVYEHFVRALDYYMDSDVPSAATSQPTAKGRVDHAPGSANRKRQHVGSL